MCYYIWEHQEQLAEAIQVQSPPNGLGGIVFNYGDPYHVLNDRKEWERVPYCFVAGQFTKNYSLRLSGKIGIVGIVFWPAGLSHLLGTPMSAFTDQRFDLNLVLGKEAALLEHQFLESSTPHQRIAVIEQFLQQKLGRASIKLDVVDHAISAIAKNKGILSINQLSDDLCISPRQFRRRFTEKVGVSPKLLSRIKRFNYISQLSAEATAKWTDIVHEGGYYDQAHFIRDFCIFSGKKPSDFVNYSRSLARLVGA
ncbi:transcriptional regulator, AraC family protein [Flammeovirgaceae bacterium 311]|nr:transcriptional regulator, AraC family protein [Flammeovirgaceae bacterium 311]